MGRRGKRSKTRVLEEWEANNPKTGDEEEVAI